jgi:hypothetical protein
VNPRKVLLGVTNHGATLLGLVIPPCRLGKTFIGELIIGKPIGSPESLRYFKDGIETDVSQIFSA